MYVAWGLLDARVRPASYEQYTNPNETGFCGAHEHVARGIAGSRGQDEQDGPAGKNPPGETAILKEDVIEQSLLCAIDNIAENERRRPAPALAQFVKRRGGGRQHHCARIEAVVVFAGLARERSPRRTNFIPHSNQRLRMATHGHEAEKKVITPQRGKTARAALHLTASQPRGQKIYPWLPQLCRCAALRPIPICTRPPVQ